MSEQATDFPQTEPAPYDHLVARRETVERLVLLVPNDGKAWKVIDQLEGRGYRVRVSLAVDENRRLARPSTYEMVAEKIKGES